MVQLSDDVVFVMRRPRFDRVSCQLVEGELHVDLLNRWHTTHQLARPETAQLLEH